MKPKQRFLNSIDIALIAGIVFFSLAGAVYAVFSGVISVPGIKPVLQADVKPSPVAKKSVTTPKPSSSVAADASAATAVSPAASATTSPAATSPDPQAELKARDAVRKEAVATVQASLQQYFNKYKKYPLTNSGADKYEKIESALKVIVDTGFIAALPVDPTADRFYMYLSDGKTFSLTTWLEDTSDPSGANNAETPPKYLYTVKNP